MFLPEDRISSRGFKLIAGVDEAGRGPLAGPVVAAAVIFDKSSRPPGIRDSKQLSPKQREVFFYKICEHALSVGVGIVNEKVIDRINILQAAHLAMLRAVFGLELAPDFIIFDGIHAPKSGIPQKCIVEGDRKSPAIGAASIIAKVTRDRIMQEHQERYPEYGFARNKGYGTKEHISSLNRSGPCKIHRFSFKPVAEAAKLFRKKPGHIDSPNFLNREA